MKTVLLTGFDPFGGENINPAWEVAKNLHEKTIGEYKIISKQVPTVFHSFPLLIRNDIRDRT